MTYNSFNPNGYTVESWEDLVDAGWKSLMRALQGAAKGRETFHGMEPVTLTQVKEKFGQLRIYYTGGDQVFRNFVDFAELVSSAMCETCGARGNTKSFGGYLKTVCEEHGVTDTD